LDTVNNILGYQVAGSPVFEEFSRWQIRQTHALPRLRHGQLTCRDDSAAGSDHRYASRSRRPNGIRLYLDQIHSDRPSGRAERYFLKYVKFSIRPIVEFAPADNSARDTDKARFVQKVGEFVPVRSKGKHLKTAVGPGEVGTEPRDLQRTYPDRFKVHVFGMTEHVAGDLVPATVGKTESFTIHDLRPHSWFFVPRQPGLGSCRRAATAWPSVPGTKTGT
jgi:hypothetical protein